MKAIAGMKTKELTVTFTEDYFEQFKKHCDKQGLTDVGVFVISTPGLHDLIGAFAESTPRSAATGELNLLPLFPFLQNHGWSVESSLVADPTEASGINTAAELDSARMRLEAMQ